jgi:hypothetical protein
MPQVLKIWSETRLRASIERIGLVTPIYKLSGETIDGRKREPIARALGKPVNVVHLLDEQQVLQTLWELHPDRALSRIGDGTLVSYAEKLGVPLSEVAQVLSRLRPRTTRDTRRERERWKGTKPSVVMAVTPPSLRALLQLCATRDARTLSELSREALLKRIRESIGPAEIVKVWREHRMHDDGALGDEMAQWIANLKSG